MRRITILFLCFLLLAPTALAISKTCTNILELSRIDQSVRLCSDTYTKKGISIAQNNIVLDCGTAVLKGSFKETGITVNGRENITIRNCQIANYETGILVKGSKNVLIIDSNLMRNTLGVKLIDSTGVVIENSKDISISKTLQLINSVGNTFHYTNRKLEGEQCRLNQCNTPSGIAAHQQAMLKDAAPKNALARLLRDNLRIWLAG